MHLLPSVHYNFIDASVHGTAHPYSLKNNYVLVAAIFISTYIRLNQFICSQALHECLYLVQRCSNMMVLNFQELRLP
ncbi:hypothetical protein BS78_09G229800 [Paspalum vaginatum]|nr:hypothetical protein BS78_09G229800 [Paspalum vaginatum]